MVARPEITLETNQSFNLRQQWLNGVSPLKIRKLRTAKIAT